MHRRKGPDGREGLIVSATDLVGFLECGHLTNLERAAADGLVPKPHQQDPEVELLQRRGGEHEQRYIDELEGDGRQVTRLIADWDRPYEQRAAETEDLMRQRADVIYQATVFDGRWVGHPDFLLRVDGPSELGDWHYEVADTKLAHSAKAGALVQMCSYVEQVARIQGVTPENVYVVTGGAKVGIHPFRTADIMAYYRHAKARFEQELTKAAVWPIERAVSYPDPVEHCAVCRWIVACKHQWRADDALPLVAGITPKQRDELLALGVATRGALARADAGAKFERVKDQARLQVASDGHDVPEFELLEPEQDAQGGVLADRGLSALPRPSAGDLFFDIEGDPFAFWEGLEYLFGVWEQGGYGGFWALDRPAEKDAFEQVIDLFMERWRQDPTMHVYHYGAYEPSHLKQLAGRHGAREEELDQLLRGHVFVDLFRVVRQGLRVGTERYSIKNLEPLYGYRREIELRDANSSIVEFEKLLEIGDPDGSLKEKIRLYNRDDCISTEQLRDWLEERRSGAARQFGGELPRPSADAHEPSEEFNERQARVHALEERLKSVGDDTTTLLADLLDWHRRENKASWWRYFDLMSKSDDELLEEKEPIAGLEFVETWHMPKPKRSDLYRYRFPAQEYRIKLGVALFDPATQAPTGSAEAIDADAGTIDIKRSREWDGPDPSAVVPKDIYNAPEQAAALMRIGEWVAEHGVEAESEAWRAARDLLLRRPPRAGQLAGECLVREDESGTQAARRLAVALDATTLAVQGPPGSGKTWTGARMILDLVRDGRRVGITANSHKVVTNLLDKVCAAARESGVPLRAMQKVDGDDGCTDDLVKCVDDNGQVESALLGDLVDVVGGTPWLWARSELSGLIDTLFVDEAGQVSLANVVAMSGAARNVVLLGDPQQLDQPTQGAHPAGAGVSALTHFLGKDQTVPDDRRHLLREDVADASRHHGVHVRPFLRGPTDRGPRTRTPGGHRRRRVRRVRLAVGRGRA